MYNFHSLFSCFTPGSPPGVLAAMCRSPLKCFHINGQTKLQLTNALTTLKDAYVLSGRTQSKVLQAAVFCTTKGIKLHVVTVGGRL